MGIKSREKKQAKATGSMAQALEAALANPVIVIEPVKPVVQAKLHLVESPVAKLRRIQEELGHEDNRYREVTGPDGIVRQVVLQLVSEGSEAIQWLMTDGTKTFALLVIGVRCSKVSGGGVAYLICRPSDGKIRPIHLVGRLRASECKARGIDFRDRAKLLSVAGKPETAGFGSWSYDPEGQIVIRSFGSTKLSVDDVFSAVANAMTENQAVVGCFTYARRNKQ